MEYTGYEDGLAMGQEFEMDRWEIRSLNRGNLPDAVYNYFLRLLSIKIGIA